MTTDTKRRDPGARSPGAAVRRLFPAASLAALALLGAGWLSWPLGGAGQSSAQPAGETAGKGRAAGANGANGSPSRAQPVSVGTVRRQDIRVTVNAIGSVAAANTAIVRARVDGELKALHFKEGQPVRAGQLLAEIDPAPFEIALRQAQGALARDEAQLKNARLDLERFRELLAKDAIARQQADTQEALVRQLQGTVQAGQAQVDNARLQLSYTRIGAPIGGLAGLKQVDPGNHVRAADTGGLLSIAQMQPANVVFAVPDLHLPKILERMKTGAALRVEAWDREQKNRLAEGTVAAVDNAIDPATGTIKLKASFANTDGRLFPNQFVNVRLQLDTLRDALAVPASALLRSAQGNYVYVIGEDDGTASVAIRGVLAGEGDGSWVSVLGKLKPGDRVVTDGTDRLRGGAKVEIVAPANGKTPDKPAEKPAESEGEKAKEGVREKVQEKTQEKPQEKSREKAAAPLPAPAAPAAPATPASPPPVASGADERPAWLDRLPPEAAERLMKLSPEERQAWLRKRLEERARRAAEGEARQ